MKVIPFSPPHIDQFIIDEVVDTLKSGWLTTGPKTKKLESEIELLSNTKKVLCVNSCTAGMELMLRWFGVQEGDEVIVPSYTYCATANVVLHCGATPIMVDVLRDDFTIDTNLVKRAITSKTKAIMPVDLGGMPVNYKALRNLVNDPEIQDLFNPITNQQKLLNRILLLTDAAHSIGAIYEGFPSASQADVTVLSFHAVKNLTTVEGGAICLNLPDQFDSMVLYNRLNKLTVHGQSKDALAKFGKNSWEYDVEEAGYKLNMPDILASIGLVEISRYKNDILQRRNRIFNIYTNELEKYEWAEIPSYQTTSRVSSFHLYLLRIKNIDRTQRNLIIDKIFSKNVSVNVHYKPLPELTLYKNLGYDIDDYPISKDTYNRVITLPVFYGLSDNDVNIVLDAVISSVEEVIDI